MFNRSGSLKIPIRLREMLVEKHARSPRRNAPICSRTKATFASGALRCRRLSCRDLRKQDVRVPGIVTSLEWGTVRFV
jgi:hypothetical protein